MELELQRACLNGFDLVLDRTVMQEETLESIVPDACPDIMRIVDAGGQACLTAKDLSAGSLRMAGSIRVSVVYIPDGEEGPRHLEVPLPFVSILDDPAIQSGCRVMAAPRLCAVDARAINPRKILVRAELMIAVRIYAPGTCSAATGVNCGEGDGIQQRLLEQEICQITSVQEKPFTFSDVLTLPSSRPRAEELLRSHAEPRNLEAKIIGSKLILKGEVALTVLCRAGDGSVFQAQFLLPYSQIVELGGTHEEAEALVEPALTGMECVLQPGDPGAVAVTLELLAQTAVWEKQAITLLTDLYSTRCAVEAERVPFQALRLEGWESRRENVRQFCECGIPAGTVLNCELAVGRLTRKDETGKSSFQAETHVTVLFLSEDGALCSVSYPIQAVCDLPGDGDCQVLCRCAGTGELTAVPVTGGLEVRFELDFFFLMTKTVPCPCVGGLKELPPPAEDRERPSVVLRLVGENEELWDIAKSCGSTIDDIVAANELEQASAPAGMLLLIPRSR